MSEEYIHDMRIRSADIEYEYWQTRLEAAKIELEIAKRRMREHTSSEGGTDTRDGGGSERR